MANWYRVRPEDVPLEGAMREVTIEGRAILLACANGQYYATQGRCPHLGGRLSHGKLEGTQVTCPRHGSKFDLATGQVVAWLDEWPDLVQSVSKILAKPRGLETYAVKFEDGQLWVAL